MSQRVARRKVQIALIIVLLPLLVAQGRNRGDLSGIWEGDIDVKGTSLGIVVEFRQGEKVEWIGDIDIEVQGAKDIPLDNIFVDAGEIRFEMPGVPGDPYFEGDISSDGRVIAGNFIQGGAVFPFGMALRDSSKVAAEATALRQKLGRIRQFVDTVRAVWQVPGVSLGIIYNDKAVLSQGFGFRNLDDSLPATRTTMYPIGSVTKSFTAAALALLVDRDQLDWDEPVRTYLPKFKLYDRWASEHVTVRDLLTHRTGLPRHETMWYNSSATRDELVARLAYLEPNLEFRTGFQYQNLMYVAAAEVLEAISGEAWETFVKKNLFVPVGAARSNFSINNLEKVTDHALGYRLVDEEVQAIPYRDLSAITPAGGINASVVDLLRWVRFQLRHGVVGAETQLLASSLIDEMHRPAIAIGDDSPPEQLITSYGLGWFVQSYRGLRRIYHGGTIDGFTALVSLYPDRKLGIVALANLDGTPLPEIVTHYAADEFLELQPVDFHGRKLVEETQLELLQQESGEIDWDKDRHEGTKPSHRWGEYAGTYFNPGYGELQIEQIDKKKLRLTYNGLRGELEHYHYDIFRAVVSGLPHERWLLSFRTDDYGDVNEVSAPLEPLVSDIVFKRLAPMVLFEPDSLTRYTGFYDLSGQTIRVELKGDQLVAILPGQPTWELTPIRQHEFEIIDLNGYSVEFEVSRKGDVERVLFKQPNGIFEAERIGPLDYGGDD